MVETEYPYPASSQHAGVRWNRPRMHPLFVRLSIISGAALLLALPFGAFSEFSSTGIVWITAGILLLLAFYGYRITKRRGENPWLSPVSILMTFYFIKYGFGSLAVYYWSSLPWQVFPSIGETFIRYGIQDQLANACQLFLLGGMGLYLGAELPARRVSEWLPPLRWQVNNARFSLNLALYSPIAIFIFLILNSYVPITFQFTVLLFGWIIWVMIVIVSYRLFSSYQGDGPKWLLLLGLQYAGTIPLFFLSGMREHMLKPTLMIVLGYIMARGRLPWKFVALGIPLAFFFLSPWLSLYKLGWQSDQSMLEMITATNAQFAEMPVRGRVELALDGLVGRIAGAGAGAASVFSQYYPDVYPFELGRTFIIELSALVPRVLWPDKPNLNDQLNKYTHGTGTLQESEDTSAVFDAISEYYINFGTIGVFLLSILQGYYLKVLYEWLVRRSIYEIGASIFIVVFFINHDFYGLVQVAISQTRLLVVWPLILYVMSRKS